MIAYFSLQLFLLKYSLSSALSSQPSTIFVIHRRDKVPRPYQTTDTIRAPTKARTGVQKTTTLPFLLYRCWPSTTYHRQLHENRDPDVYASRCSGEKHWQDEMTSCVQLLGSSTHQRVVDSFIKSIAVVIIYVTLQCKKYCGHGLKSVHLRVLPQEVQNR